MKHVVYILWSDKLQRYYCGETSDFEARFLKHNAGQAKYTSKGTPWKLVIHFEVEDRSAGRQLESKIKNRGIKRYLECL